MVDKIAVDDFVEMFGQYTVLELAEINEKLKEKYNITAAAPVAVAGVAPGAAEAAEEQTEFDVILKEAGSQKIPPLAAIRRCAASISSSLTMSMTPPDSSRALTAPCQLAGLPILIAVATVSGTSIA